MDIELLTVSEVAEILKVSKSMVYTLVARKEINCIRVGIGRGTIRISREELRRFTDSRKNIKNLESFKAETDFKFKFLKCRIQREP